MWRDVLSSDWGEICDTLAGFDHCPEVWDNMYSFPDLVRGRGWVVHVWTATPEVWAAIEAALSEINGVAVSASALTEHPSYYA